METKILLTAVLLIVFVCEYAAAPKRSTKIRRGFNTNGRTVAGRRLVPVDSRRRPSWLRKRNRRPVRPGRNKPKKLRKKNTPKKAKATKKNDGLSTLVDIQYQSSPKAGQAVRKGLKKNERYFDPKILEKLNRIHSMQDVVREFKPEGFRIKKETKLVRKISNDRAGITGPQGPPGFSGINRSREEAGVPGPNYVLESKVEDVVYYRDRKVMDQPPADAVQLGCSLTTKQESISALGSFFYPSCVPLKRCSGCCKFGQECTAVGKTNKTIDVFEFKSVGAVKFVKKTFIEHTSCSCQCVVKASDCNPKQTYSQQHCQCECNRTPQTCPAGKIWSRGNCDCICSNRQICELTRQKWDEKTCSCICSNTECPNGAVIDKQACRCIYPALDLIGPLRSKEPARDSLSLVKSSVKSSSKSTFTDDFDAPSSGNEQTGAEEEEDEDGESEDDAWDEV